MAKDIGWRRPELLGEIASSNNFYFDKLVQIKMPAWSKGRVVLVGDAAYCASPAAGRGGSLALDGAAALAAFTTYGDDPAAAYWEYERSFRPFIEQVQADANYSRFGIAISRFLGGIPWPIARPPIEPKRNHSGGDVLRRKYVHAAESAPRGSPTCS